MFDTSGNHNHKVQGSQLGSSSTSLRDMETALKTNTAHAEERGSINEPQASPRPVKGLLWMLVVAAILSSTFLFSLDNTVVTDVQPTIARQFGSIDKLTWLSVGYLLGSTTTILLW